MLNLRDHCTPRERRAHAILDAVQAGLEIDADAVDWALRTLGDLV